MREREAQRLQPHGDDPTRRRRPHENRRYVDAQPSSRLLQLLLQQFEQLQRQQFVLVAEFEQLVLE
jgi:hypothetical protein